MELGLGGIFWLLVVLAGLYHSVKIINQYERGVVFRLGRVLPEPVGPGLVFLIPVLDRLVRIDMRTLTLDVPPQDIITRDNVTLQVNAVVYFRVVDPIKAVIEVENFMFAASQLAQTTLRSVLGQVELDELLAKREVLNQKIRQILDAQTLAWGIQVTHVEVKQIDLPADMQRAMAKQAEAERERRAKLISAEAEYQAAHQLQKAAQEFWQNPVALQLRYLQTLKEVAQNSGHVILVPLPSRFFFGDGDLTAVPSSQSNSQLTKFQTET